MAVFAISVRSMLLMLFQKYCFYYFACWKDVQMTAKPTYEELVKRIEKLEQETFKHKQVEKKLQEREALLRSILQAVPIGIGVACDRVIKEANVRLCEILGYSSEEILGKGARMLYPTDEDFEYVGHEKYAQIHENGIGAVETRFRHKEGNVMDVLLSSAPIDPENLSIGEPLQC
jgi:PAS domain S-box-containing protein